MGGGDDGGEDEIVNVVVPQKGAGRQPDGGVETEARD